MGGLKYIGIDIDTYAQIYKYILQIIGRQIDSRTDRCHLLLIVGLGQWVPEGQVPQQYIRIAIQFA